MELETERLILREFQEGDWQAMHEYASDPEVVRYMQWTPKTEEETREYVRRAIANQQEKPRRNYQFVLILKAEKRLIGACSIINVSSPEDGEAGIVYVLNRNFWNQGYMTEVVKRVIHFGFSELGLHRMYATLAPENVASACVLEKAGMRREGHLRKHRYIKGEWRDSLLYAILESERR
jgi:ribosomal-protein-alanine N-acetyltransferase